MGFFLSFLKNQSDSPTLPHPKRSIKSSIINKKNSYLELIGKYQLLSQRWTTVRQFERLSPMVMRNFALVLERGRKKGGEIGRREEEGRRGEEGGWMKENEDKKRRKKRVGGGREEEEGGVRKKEEGGMPFFSITEGKISLGQNFLLTEDIGGHHTVISDEKKMERRKSLEMETLE